MSKRMFRPYPWPLVLSLSKGERALMVGQAHHQRSRRPASRRAASRTSGAATTAPRKTNRRPMASRPPVVASATTGLH
jgi:hypothetical protein